MTSGGGTQTGRAARRWFADRPIAVKLAIGLGVLGVLTAVAIAVGLLAGNQAGASIDLTTERRAPLALASTRAQAGMLRMVGNVQGYLALGDRDLRAGYVAARTQFEADLAELERLAEFGAEADPSTTRLRNNLAAIGISYAEWKPLPDELFAIRDDQLRREPALRILIEDATPRISAILGAIHDTTRTLRAQPASARTQLILEEFGDYEASFLSVVSGLRGYVTTGRDLFKFEYTSNLTINRTAWASLAARRDELDHAGQQALDRIDGAQTALGTTVDAMFALVEGDRAREDLYRFRTEAVGLADGMIRLLDEVTASERDLLQRELAAGRDGLSQARLITLGVGALVLAAGLLVAAAITRAIARPVERLTATADRIHGGDLDARAEMQAVVYAYENRLVEPGAEQRRT